MAGFKDIIGHTQIIEHLQSAIELDKVSHAYIFNGPDKSGKRMLAEAFAMAWELTYISKFAVIPLVKYSAIPSFDKV